MAVLSSDFIWILFRADIKVLQLNRLGQCKYVHILKCLLENVVSQAKYVEPVFQSLEMRIQHSASSVKWDVGDYIEQAPTPRVLKRPRTSGWCWFLCTTSLKGDWMTATQQLSKGALGIFATSWMAGPSLKLIDSAKQRKTKQKTQNRQKTPLTNKKPH